TVGADGRLAVWEASTGPARAVWSFQGQHPIVFARMEPSGEHVTFIEREQYFARVIAVGASTPGTDLWGHTMEAQFAALAPDGRRVVSTAADGTAIVWTLNDAMKVEFRRLVFSLKGPVRCAAFDGEGRRVAAGTSAGMLTIASANGTAS